MAEKEAETVGPAVDFGKEVGVGRLFAGVVVAPTERRQGIRVVLGKAAQV